MQRFAFRVLLVLLLGGLAALSAMPAAFAQTTSSGSGGVLGGLLQTSGGGVDSIIAPVLSDTSDPTPGADTGSGGTSSTADPSPPPADIVTRTLDLAAPVINPVLQPLNAVIAPVTPAGAESDDTVGAVGGVVNDVITTVSDVVAPVVAPLLDQATGLVDGVVAPVVQNVVAPVLTDVAQTVGQVIAPVGQVIQPVVDTLMGGEPPAAASQPSHSTTGAQPSRPETEAAPIAPASPNGPTAPLPSAYQHPVSPAAQGQPFPVQQLPVTGAAAPTSPGIPAESTQSRNALLPLINNQPGVSKSNPSRGFAPDASADGTGATLALPGALSLAASLPSVFPSVTEARGKTPARHDVALEVKYLPTGSTDNPTPAAVHSTEPRHLPLATASSSGTLTVAPGGGGPGAADFAAAMALAFVLLALWRLTPGRRRPLSLSYCPPVPPG